MSEQFAYLGTGRKTHRIKYRPGLSNWIARCGLQAFREEDWVLASKDFYPCLKCTPKKSSKWQVEKWDRWP